MSDANTPDDQATRTNLSGPPSSDVGLPSIGAHVGRFQILDRLGVGGAGEVFSAYDPQLDRRIAIKFLLATPGEGRDASERATRRLLREGRALAHVEHPNVVGVHEMGTDHGRVFMAMDYVQGVTLKQWLLRHPPARNQLPRVLEILRQAGRGLAAAHETGLIHRDVKPSNILVGDDGRVRVADFGLARSDGRQGWLPDEDLNAPSPSVELDAPIDGRVTRTGAVAGTPADMAPEQLAGEKLSPRTDQYGLSMVAWEAIFGIRPSRADALGEGPTPTRAPPRGYEYVPAQLVAALRKGLEPRPSARHSSMTALLGYLEMPSTRSARRRVTVVALVGSAAVASGVYVLADADEDHPCAMGQAQIERVWNDERSDALVQALTATPARYAAESTQRVQTTLDEYAAAWVEGYRDACEATHVRRVQSEDRLAERMTCLERRRRELEAVVSVLSQPDPSIAERALELTGSLPPVDPCADVAFVGATVEPPRDPEVRARVEALREELAYASKLDRVGKYQEATRRATAVLEGASAVDYPPLLAEAQLVVGSSQSKTDRDEAEQYLRSAFMSAQAAGHDSVASTAAERLAFVVGVRRRRYPEALVWVDIAKAGAIRRGEAEGPLMARALRTEGMLHLHLEDWDATREAIEASRALFERIEGSENSLLSLLQDEGTMLLDRGHGEQAKQRFEQVLERRRLRFGEHHPRVAQAYQALGLAEMRLNDTDAARVALERALAMTRDFEGHDGPRVAELMMTLGGVLNTIGDQPPALRMHQRSYRIFETTYGPHHPLVAGALANIAITQHWLARYEEAETNFVRAIELNIEQVGPDHTDVARSLYGLADVRRALGRRDEALADYGRAWEIYAARSETVHPVAVAITTDRAATLVEASRRVEALALLERVHTDLVKDRGTEAAATLSVLRPMVPLLRHVGRDAEADAARDHLAAVQADEPAPE
ncbi:MAG: tetratricopeptide repeat protein [Deltaproteobacteria bacterium]|nr:tetratricopeptide repeat protein [Deltaproteobacteria bacterium]